MAIDNLSLGTLGGKPLISILVLTYNQAEYINAALSSIINQRSTEFDIEIIITDDGSSDGTIDVIKSFSNNSQATIKVLAKEHEGVTAIAKNFLSMINIARGDFIAFLAGDDSFPPERFTRQVEKFASNPNLKISYSEGVNCTSGIFGLCCHSLETVELMKSGDAEKVYNYLTSRAPVLFIQGVLAKADFLKEIQPFDTDLIADDWVFNIKVFDALIKSGGDFDFESNVCFIRNIHGNNTSRNLIVHYERVRQVAERYCRNARLIKSRFIGYSLLSAIKKKRKDEFIFFFRKTFKFPEAFYWFFKSIFVSFFINIFRS